MELAEPVERGADRAEQEGVRTALPEVGEERLRPLPWRVLLDGGRVCHDEFYGSSEPFLLGGAQEGGASGGEPGDLPV